MNRITSWLGVALLTFIVGVAGAYFWIHRSRGREANTNLAGAKTASEPELAELSYCQVVIKAEEYEGEVIRLHGVYSFGLHGATIGETGCMSEATQTWVSLTPAMRGEVERAMENAYGKKNVSGPLDIVAVGRFGRNNPSHLSDAWKDTLPFRFELMRLEKAVRVF